MAKTKERERFKPASEKEAARQLMLIRNGLHIEHGFALDFSRKDPVMKLTESYLKEREAEYEETLKGLEALDEEAASVADFLLPIESFATAPRTSGSTAPVAAPETTAAQERA